LPLRVLPTTENVTKSSDSGSSGGLRCLGERRHRGGSTTCRLD